MEGESEEAAFVEAFVEPGDAGAEVEEGGGAAGAVGFEDVDHADLVRHEEAVGVEGGDDEGGDEAVGHLFERLGGELGVGGGGEDEREGEGEAGRWERGREAAGRAGVRKPGGAGHHGR